jgi:hypothetical protein
VGFSPVLIQKLLSNANIEAAAISRRLRCLQEGGAIVWPAICLFQVLIKPIDHSIVPKLRILWFEDPVTFVGVIEQLGIHTLTLQRCE